MTVYFNKISSVIADLTKGAAPYVTSFHSSALKVLTLLNEKRSQLGTTIGEKKIEITAGVTLGLTFFWLYLAIFVPSKKPTATVRPQIPFKKELD